MFSLFKRIRRRPKASSPQPRSVAKVQSGASAVQPQPSPVSDPTRPETAERAIPDELIAARAYQLWQLRGSPSGEDGSGDWYAAKAELEREWRDAAPPRSRELSY